METWPGLNPVISHCIGRRENFLTLISFRKILPLKDDELVMSEI